MVHEFIRVHHIKWVTVLQPDEFVAIDYVQTTKIEPGIQ